MILFVDGRAGISGDMLLSAFLEMGLPLSKLHRMLGDLGLNRVKIHLERVSREGFPAVRISVRGEPSHIPSTRVGDIVRWIQGSGCDLQVKRSMVRLFKRLGLAEAAAHRRHWRKVLFHQLGQPDTVVVLMGLSAGLIHFGVREVYASPVPIGSRYQDHHGRWQARPGPATRWLLRRFRAVQSSEFFEWSTPTGAAFLSVFASGTPAPPFEVLRIGHGVGHGRPPHGPTVLRLLLGRPI